MANYYRITTYHKGLDMSCIIDSYGMFEKLWEFSSYMVLRDFEIVAVSRIHEVLDVNIDRMEIDLEKMGLRAYAKGRPIETTAEVSGTRYKAIMVEDKVYVPNRNSIALKSSCISNDFCTQKNLKG